MSAMEPRKHVIHFEVSSESQAKELDAVCTDILLGKRTRLGAATEDLHEIMERARTALELILQSIANNASSGQTRRLIKFLASLHNGDDYPFDLTSLRTLDSDLAAACIDYLNYDRVAKVEIHTHLPGGNDRMQTLLCKARLSPRLKFSRRDDHEARLIAAGERSERGAEELLAHAAAGVLATEEAKTFGVLSAARAPTDGERPRVHARFLRESRSRPLCGADDGPWSPGPFKYERLTCLECQSRLLDPNDDPTQKF